MSSAFSYLFSLLPSKYAKGVMAILGIAATVLTPYYGGDKWYGAVVGALTVAGVIGTPNKTTTPAAPPVNPPAAG